MGRPDRTQAPIMCIQADTVQSHLFIAKKRGKGDPNSKRKTPVSLKAALLHTPRVNGYRRAPRRASVPEWEVEMQIPVGQRASPSTLTISNTRDTQHETTKNCNDGLTASLVSSNVALKAPSTAI